MGKTHRDVENVGHCRILRTLSHQRGSISALDELREAGVQGNFSRIRQQAFRHTVKCPNTWDDAPVSALDEKNEKPAHHVRVWHVGGEISSVPLKELRSYLDTLLSEGIKTVEVWWGDSFAVLTYRSGYSGSSWRSDAKGGSASWRDLERMLEPRPRYRFRKSEEDITALLRKPSASTVAFLRHRTEGLIEIRSFVRRLDEMHAIDLLGAVVQLGRKTYTLDLPQMKAVFGKRTRKGRLTFTFWYLSDNERMRLHLN